jgi:hypothetical protein
MISSASRSRALLPGRSRAYCDSQRIASEVARSGRTSTGT